MQPRTYYTCAILLPLAIFAAVALAGVGADSSTLGLGPGATVRWLYPRAGIRELVAYGAVALWLLWTLQRRPLEEFHQAIWRAPIVLAVIHFLFPLAVILANGVMRRVAAEQGGRILLRVLVRLLVGYGYVALIEWVRRQLEPPRAANTNV